MGYHVLHTRASILSYSPGEPTGNSLPIAERNSRKRAEDSARTSRGMIVTRYTTREDEMLHRGVVSAVNGLVQYLQCERKKVPGEVLWEADRLECLLFGGYDP